jgi:endoglycosylceramidase
LEDEIMRKLLVSGKKFVDDTGAHVILSGINFVCKEKALGYIAQCDEDVFEWFKALGFNVIRLGLIWDGVEPEPLRYDDEYLNKIKRFAALAEKNDIYVFLDMHQDLYSCRWGDGAPEWATFTDGQPHIGGEMWSDAYLQSGAVMKSLDHFWNNTPASDGIGLQDHYAKMWAHVADVFKECGNIIGYDIMNEPAIGSLSESVLGDMILAYAKKVLNITEPDLEELAALWMDQEKRVDILNDMSEWTTFKSIIENSGAAAKAFDRDILTPFFAKITSEIRKIDAEGFIFTEANYFSNIAIQSEIGRVDNAQVFSPHGYDLVVDTDKYDAYSQQRVDYIFDTHRKVQDRLDMPVLVGEWGAFTDFDVTYELAIALIKVFEKNLWSNTFWCYYSGMEKCKYINALKRAYPMSASGVLTEYSYDFQSGNFNMECQNVSTSAATVIYYPEAEGLSSKDIRIEGAECGIEIIKYDMRSSGIIIITPKNETERLVVCINSTR